MSEKLGEWPYPIKYEEETEVNCDVLVLGGGVAGCFAAIAAANKGAKVVLVDKGPVISSGSGGAGVDHWNFPCTAPFCEVSPEELTDFMMDLAGGWDNAITRYIQAKESWDCLQDVEKWGLPLRDVDDEFKGAPFRDEESKILFAYDYKNKHMVRVRGGAKVKKYYLDELKRLKVPLYERVMVTSLLTEGGKPGNKVVGATGINSRTGEFYIFKAKATISCMSTASSVWVFARELMGSASSIGCPLCTGEGFSIAWNAGAELALMEKSAPAFGQFQYAWLGVGYHSQTWYACNIVDDDGKEISWVGDKGKKLATLEERYYPPEGKKLTMAGIPMIPSMRGAMKYMPPMMSFDLPSLIKSGKVKLPLYADLPSMPEHERRAIFGLMVGNEGRTRVPVYENYTAAGFDPDKDMLQAPILNPNNYLTGAWFWDAPHPKYRSQGIVSGGLVFDWDLKTNLEGLWVAGLNGFCGLDHSSSATSGRYCGRKAAKHAQSASEPVIDRAQVDAEKARVYAPIKQKSGMGWKELNAGICRIMQDHVGSLMHENTLKLGLRWLKDIGGNEAATAYARNPHELIRTLECLTLLTVGEIIIHASLAREASSSALMFSRIDYPKRDKPEWNKFVTIRKENGEVKVGELPLDYWKLPPYAPTYEENYNLHADL